MRLPTRFAAAALVLSSAPALLAQTTTPTSVDTDSPKAAVKSFVTAQINGDGRAIRELLQTNGPTDEKMAGAIADLSVAIADLNKAMIAKFGAQPTQQLMGDPNDALKANLDKLDHATATVTGDTATVVSAPDAAAPTPPGTPAPATGAPTPDGPSPQDTMTLHKVNGQWKVAVSDLAKGSTDENVQKTLASVNTAVAGYRSVLADLNAGKLANVDAVKSALDAKMMGTGTPPPAGTPGVAPGATPPVMPGK